MTPPLKPKWISTEKNPSPPGQERYTDHGQHSLLTTQVSIQRDSHLLADFRLLFIYWLYSGVSWWSCPADSTLLHAYPIELFVSISLLVSCSWLDNSLEAFIQRCDGIHMYVGRRSLGLLKTCSWCCNSLETGIKFLSSVPLFYLFPFLVEKRCDWGPRCSDSSGVLCIKPAKQGLVWVSLV